jgi:hypothetical protein
VLIEPTKFLGGLTTGGLGATDIGNKKAIGGLSREFYTAIGSYYAKDDKWVHQTRAEYFARRPNGNVADEGTMWTFEPHVATAVYDQMLKTAGDKVTVVFGERLDLKKGVVKDGARIVKIVMESGREFSGKMFIDATYEGDLMARAGRELPRRSRSQLRLWRNAQRRPGRPFEIPPVQGERGSLREEGRPLQRPAARHRKRSPRTRRLGRPQGPGLQLPHVHDRRPGQPPRMGEAGELRRTLV